MSKLPYRHRRTLPGSDLDEMEIIGNRTFTVAVPAQADAEFKAYILAAGATHSAGNRSIDNILRRNGSRWIRFFEHQEATNTKGLTGLRRLIVEMAISRCIEVSELSIGDNNSAGKAAAAKVLIRLESTFRAASQLIQLGYAFEAEAVIRLGFEQVAWANAVRDFTDHARVDGTSGTNNITKFKTIFPGAGPIYSRLSDLAHVAPNTHERFIAEVDGSTVVRIKAPVAAKESIRLFLVLLDAFLVLCEICFGSDGLPCQNVDRVTGRPLTLRTISSLIKEFERVLPADTVNYFEKWSGG